MATALNAGATSAWGPGLITNARCTLADAFATIMTVLVRSGVTHPEPRVLRRALHSWAFNKKAELPARQRSRGSRCAARGTGCPVPQAGRQGGCCQDRTGKRAAFNEVLNITVEKGCFTENPLNGLWWNAPAVDEGVDPAAVPDPAKVARLLTAVAQQRGRGPHPEAFFGCMYYAAMRPAEVMHLRFEQHHLPDSERDAQPPGWRRQRRQGVDGRRLGRRAALPQARRGYRDPTCALTRRELASKLASGPTIFGTPGSRSGCTPVCAPRRASEDAQAPRCLQRPVASLGPGNSDGDPLAVPCGPLRRGQQNHGHRPACVGRQGLGRRPPRRPGPHRPAPLPDRHPPASGTPTTARTRTRRRWPP